MSDSPFTRTVVDVLPDGPDREVRVSTLDAGELGHYIEMREYIPSLDRYGRGLTVPAELVHDLVNALSDAAYAVAA